MTDAINFIDLKAQFRELEVDIRSRIDSVLAHGRYIMGPEIEELETQLASYCNVGHCIGVSSGTEALLIALMALDVGPGDEIVTSPFTFVATAEVIALLGATPVFVDVEYGSCNMEASRLESAITDKTKAIIPVSLYGQCPDMDEINAIAEKHGGVPVIEDGAQSFGAIYRGRKSCGLSTFGCTSFFPSKPLGCYGDGGAIFTNDDELAEACRQIRVHGQSKRYHHTRIGVGGRLDTMQAAILLAKLPKFDWELEQRKRIGAAYLESLHGLNHLELPEVADDRDCVWGQFTLKSDRRDDVISVLKQAGIPTAVHYPMPLHLQPAYVDHHQQVGSLEVSERVAERVFSIPMHPYMDDATQGRIVEAITKSNTL